MNKWKMYAQKNGRPVTVGRWPVNHPNVQAAVDSVISPSGKDPKMTLDLLLWHNLSVGDKQYENWGKSRTDWLPHTAAARQADLAVLPTLYDPRRNPGKWKVGSTGKVLYNEHVVPWRVVYQELQSCQGDRGAIEQCLSRLYHIAVITPQQNAHLSARFNDCMPPGWDPQVDDPWARYHAIGLVLGPAVLGSTDKFLAWRHHVQDLGYTRAHRQSPLPAPVPAKPEPAQPVMVQPEISENFAKFQAEVASLLAQNHASLKEVIGQLASSQLVVLQKLSRLEAVQSDNHALRSAVQALEARQRSLLAALATNEPAPSFWQRFLAWVRPAPRVRMISPGALKAIIHQESQKLLQMSENKVVPVHRGEHSSRESA